MNGDRAPARASASEYRAGVQTVFPVCTVLAPGEAGSTCSLLPIGELWSPGRLSALLGVQSRRTSHGTFCFWSDWFFSTHSGGGIHWLVEQILCLDWGEGKVRLLLGKGLWHSKGESSANVLFILAVPGHVPRAAGDTTEREHTPTHVCLLVGCLEAEESW